MRKNVICANAKNGKLLFKKIPFRLTEEKGFKMQKKKGTEVNMAFKIQLFVFITYLLSAFMFCLS